jgi:4-hydroxy-tetrahydrodipicolinate synthase
MLPLAKGKARRGVYAAAVSPLNDAGRLDAPKLVAYCQFLLSKAGGCDGVAPLGTTGEGASLEFSDKLSAIDAFAEAGVPADQVILGTGMPSIGDAAFLCQVAVDSGLFNLLVLPPYYYKSPTDDGLYAAFARLIERVGDDRLRLYLYHFPQMSGVPISVPLVRRLKADFGPVIAGLKDSSGAFEQSRAFIEATGGIDGDFDVFPSSEAMLWDGLAIGSAGVISGSTNAFGRIVQAALQAGDGGEEMALVRHARAAVGPFNLMAAMKQVVAWRTGDATWTDLWPPLSPLNTAERVALRAALDDVGVDLAG